MKKPFAEQSREEIAVDARRDSIPYAVDFVCGYAREMRFEEPRIAEIRLALEETLGNIIRFACPTGKERIKVSCDTHEMGALLVNIVDSGQPFNMLVLSTFPEVTFESAEEMPSTKMMKKVVKDIEYRRDGDDRTNILAWVVSK